MERESGRSMHSSSPRWWHAFSTSKYEWDLRVLDFLRDSLPGEDSCPAWVLFAFTSEEGVIGQVDDTVLKNGY